MPLASIGPKLLEILDFRDKKNNIERKRKYARENNLIQMRERGGVTTNLTKKTFP